jgi:hypothetical protein
MACLQAQCLATGFGVDRKEFIDPRYHRGPISSPERQPQLRRSVRRRVMSARRTTNHQSHALTSAPKRRFSDGFLAGDISRWRVKGLKRQEVSAPRSSCNTTRFKVSRLSIRSIEVSWFALRTGVSASVPSLSRAACKRLRPRSADLMCSKTRFRSATSPIARRSHTRARSRSNRWGIRLWGTNQHHAQTNLLGLLSLSVGD